MIRSLADLWERETNSMKAFIRFIAIFLVFAVGGCGGGSSSPTPVAFLYTLGQGANAVLGLNVLSDGELGVLAVSQFPTTPIPVALTLTPSKNFLYVVNSTSNTVSGFNVNHASGDLTPIGNALPPTPVGTTPVSLGVNSSSQFLYVLNQGSSNISIFSIDSVRGILTGVGSPVAVPANPQFLLVSPTSALLFVSSGTQISAFSINADGTLSPVAGSPFTVGTDIRGMVIDPKGQFLYAADRGANQVASFTIQGSGVLAPVGGSPFPAGTQPMMVAIDSTGTFLYTANQGSNDSSAYKISSGALSPIVGSPFPTAGPGVVTPTQPVFVTVDATNQFLYFANTGSRDISGFTIKSTDGTLTAVTNSPFTQTIAPQWLLSTR
jgi:6-phosphogluconolactonase